jgi:LacI family transcriptional regulator
VTKIKSRPSIQDVARLAGVSVGTVSNTLNSPERVTPKTLNRVKQAIDQLGFVRNDAARQLKAGKSKTIGLIMIDTANQFFAGLAAGAEEAAIQSGLTVLTGNAAVNLEREASYLEVFEEQRVSGIVITPMQDVTESVLGLRQRGTPTVVADRRADPALCCSVSMDEVAGGVMAVEHLIENGARRIAFAGGPLEYLQIADRLVGAREAVSKNAGVTLEVLETIDLTVSAGRKIGDEILSRPPAERPDSIFAAADLIAVGLLQAFVFKGKIKVPNEIKIIGYDDIEFAANTIVPLSSLKQNEHQLGQKAIELLIDEIENPESHRHQAVVFKPELVVRESSTKF